MSKWNLVKETINRNLGLSLLAVLSGLFYNILTVLIPIFIGGFYEYNFGFSSIRLKLFFSKLNFVNPNSFSTFLYFFIGIIFLLFLLEYANRYVIGILGEKFSKLIREKLFAHQLRVSIPIYDEKGIGRYLLRYSGDLKSIQNYLTQGVLRFSQDVILIIILLSVVAYYSIDVSIIIMVFIVFSLGFIFLMNRTLYKISIERRDRRSGMLSFVNKSLGNILTIKTFNKNIPYEFRFNKKSSKLLDVGLKFQNISAFINSFIPFIIYLMVGVTMLYIYKLKTSGIAFDSSSFLIMVLLIISFLSTFRRVLSVNIVWKLGEISFEKLNVIFQLNTESQLYGKKIKMHENEIVFKNVTYLAGNLEKFHVVSVRIAPYTTVFIEDAFGSGKSLEFIKLLLRIHNPTEGEIYFGKFKSDSLSQRGIRKQISIVSSKIPFDGNTVYEAISNGRSDEIRIKSEQILSDLQQYLPSTQRLELNSKIGDQNLNLNESQKQLLAWCRAMLSNKKIWILHFPFHNIDKNLKEHLLNMLVSWGKSKTIIYIDEKAPTTLKIDNKLFFD